MATVFDAARYILEQKGSLRNPVLQELCRLTLRDENGKVSGESKIFEEKFVFFAGSEYPNGRICPELYNACRDEIVTPDTFPYGDSGSLTVEQKLVISETLNKHFDDVYLRFADGSSGVYDDMNSDFEEDETEKTKYFNALKVEQEESEVHDTASFEPVHDEEVKEAVSAAYSSETVMMDVSSMDNPSADYSQDTAPLNYVIRENPRHTEAPASHKKSSSAQHGTNTHERHQTVSPQPERKAEVPKPPSSGRKKSNTGILLACMSAVLLLTVVTLAVTFFADGKKDSDREPEVTMAQKIEKEEQKVVYDDSDEEEPEETTVQETEAVTESETEAVTTVPETEPVTEPETEPVTEDDRAEADGRTVLDSVSGIDVDSDGISDEIQVYRYSTGDIFYDIRYANGSMMTYTFTNNSDCETRDYIVYDKNVDMVYPAGLSIEVSQRKLCLRFTHIYGVTRFSAEYDNPKQFYVNYQPSDADSVKKYYENIDILYSLTDRDGSEMRAAVSDALK